MASQEIGANGEVPYMFNRDFNSSVRLNYNHWLMKDICGYHLNPKIKFEKENIRIADIGTGTGIWLFELVDDLPPSARLDGFDISSSQFPPDQWIPENIHLTMHDVFKPFPQECLGTYDIVNLRFALCFVNNIDAEPLLKNMISLLKPGGHLQWFEPFPLETRVKAFDASSSMVATTQLAKSWHKPKPDSTYDWVDKIPSLYEKNGLKIVDYDKILMKDRHRLLWAHANLLGLQDALNSAEVVGTDKEKGIGIFMDTLRAEFASGVSIETPFWCAVGKKPGQ